MNIRYQQLTACIQKMTTSQKVKQASIHAEKLNLPPLIYLTKICRHNVIHCVKIIFVLFKYWFMCPPICFQTLFWESFVSMFCKYCLPLIPWLVSKASWSASDGTWKKIGLEIFLAKGREKKVEGRKWR